MSPRAARAPLLLLLVWAAGVVLATSVGLLAVRVVAAQVGDPVTPALSRVVDRVPAGPELTVPTAPAPSPNASTDLAAVAPPTSTPTRPGRSSPARPGPARPGPARPGPARASAASAQPARPYPAAAVPRSTATARRPVAAPRAPRPAQSPRPATIAATFQSAGGTVGMQCTGATARLLYVTPADGYALDEQSVVGPQVEVSFQTDQTRLRMQLSCSSGSPRLVDVRTESQPGGGGEGGSGGSGSGKEGGN